MVSILNHKFPTVRPGILGFYVGFTLRQLALVWLAVSSSGKGAIAQAKSLPSAETPGVCDFVTQEISCFINSDEFQLRWTLGRVGNFYH